MLKYFPGYFQLARKKWFQGIFIFFLTMFSFLAFLKLTLFQSGNPDEFLLLGSMFLGGMVWHWISVIRIKTQSLFVPHSKEDLYQKGRLASLKGNCELAIHCFERLLKINPQDEDVLFQLGKNYFQLGEKKKARRVLKQYGQKPFKKWQLEIEELLKEMENSHETDGLKR